MKLPNPNETAMVLVEVLIYADIEEKPLLDAICENLQKQVDKLGKQSHLVRVLWYCNKGEKSLYEQKEWLKTESNSMFYVFLDKQKPIDDKYLKSLISISKKMRKCINDCKNLGIKPRAQREPDVQIARQSTIKDEFDSFELI
jgi:hypothetical protein